MHTKLKSLFYGAFLALSATANAPAAELPIRVGTFDQQQHLPFTTNHGLPSNEVFGVESTPGGGVHVRTEAGYANWLGGSWEPLETEPEAELLPLSERLPASVKDLAGGEIRDYATHGGEAAVAAEDGLYTRLGGTWALELPRDGARRWAPVDVRAVAYDAQGHLWFAAPQGVGYRVAEGEWKLFTGAEGLPFNDFTCMAAGPASVWFGTTNGAIRFDGEDWEFRQGRRWLLDNHVNDIAVGPDGTAWIATAKGISSIGSRPMTLAEKAAFYEAEIDRYHRRTEYEYVADAALTVPGVKASAEPQDTDNDGHFTGIYLASASLGYAATKDPEQKRKAHKAFEALAFLTEVTQGGSHPGPPGLICRAVRPTDGPDPNETLNPETDRERQKRDALWKVMDPRWPVDETGKWYWKCDASSDELDGYYFGFGPYYDYVCETEAERERLREVVRVMTDHLIVHNYNIVDHDGKPTRWGHFSPEDMNQNPAWWIERGLNSQSILTFLQVAHHITGDPKYREEYLKLAWEEGYAMNVMTTMKIQNGPGSLGQADDNMAFMNFYHLVRYETDEKLLNVYYNALYWYWLNEKYERNTFLDFVYAATCYGKTRTDQWRTMEVGPNAEWLEQVSIDTLKRYPLDLIDWPLSNAHRTDLITLGEHTQGFPGANENKGHGVDGVVFPIDENHAVYWGDDPWHLVRNTDGTVLNNPMSYLVAYYMGLVHGIIAE